MKNTRSAAFRPLQRAKVVCADLFCGAGGTSTGIVEACADLGREIELTAINHWPIAVQTHSQNHAAARHLCASLDALNPRDLYRENQLDVLWASPECTHHSIARGGKPVSDQSRATAWCVVRWAEALRPKVILVENVKEFQTWGPIGCNGKPLKSKRGDIFRSWVKALESIGYRVEYRVLCAANYGDPTTRKRLFVYAVRGGKPVIWPSPSHAQKECLEMFESLKPWVPAREVIDWNDKGKSIFTRKRPLAEKTLRRIFIGLEKFGLEGFIISTDHQSGGSTARPSSDPLSSVTSKQRHAVCSPFLIHLRGTSKTADLAQPAPTITAGGGHLGLINPFLVRYNGDHAGRSDGDQRVHSPENPLPNIDTSNRYALATPYLIQFNGKSETHSSAEPLGTVTTRDRFGLCQPVIELNGERYILDILFRMLKPGELAAAQGFPADYKFTGNTTEVVKQIGNAVPKNLAKALAKSAILSL